MDKLNIKKPKMKYFQKQNKGSGFFDKFKNKFTDKHNYKIDLHPEERYFKNTVLKKAGKKKVKNPNDKRARRGKLIKQIMNETGMSLSDASKYIKENNIEY